MPWDNCELYSCELVIHLLTNSDLEKIPHPVDLCVCLVVRRSAAFAGCHTSFRGCSCQVWEGRPWASLPRAGSLGVLIRLWILMKLF